MISEQNYDLLRKFAGAGTVIVAILGQIFAGLWWASSQSEKMINIQWRLSIVEQQLTMDAAAKVLQAERLARIEERVADMSKATGEINGHLASIETYLHGDATHDDAGSPRRRR